MNYISPSVGSSYLKALYYMHACIRMRYAWYVSLKLVEEVGAAESKDDHCWDCEGRSFVSNKQLGI